MYNEIEAIARALTGNLSRANLVPELQAVVRGLLSSRRTADCTLHPYGFLIARLWAEGSEALRLHIWPAEARKRQVPDWPVHSHPWDLRSHVLVGTVTNELYSVEPGSGAGAQRLYSVGYERSQSVLRATDSSVLCRLSESRSYVAGDEYSTKQDHYHASTVPDGVFAATLVLTTAQSNTPARVVGEFGYADVYRHDRGTLDEGTARAWLEQLDARLVSWILHR